MKTGFKKIAKDHYIVIATGEQFKRWSKGLNRLKNDKLYRLTVRRENVSFWTYVSGIYEMLMAIHDPNHKPRGAFFFKED